MLSRSAQGMYWMGRYLERTRHLCRLLRLQVESLVDAPLPEIQLGWSRIYQSLERDPPVPGVAHDSEEPFDLAESITLAKDLTFEHQNETSVRNCLYFARENARQTRDRISGEMWTSLNLSFLRIKRLGIEDIWQFSPQNFYLETVREIDTFIGVAHMTMYRDEGWNFLYLGRFIERAQLLISALLAQIVIGRHRDESFDGDWAALLKIYRAFDIYSRTYSVEIRPMRVLSVLVTDEKLSFSLFRSYSEISRTLIDIGPGPFVRSSDAARRLAGRLSALVHYEWPDSYEHERLLHQARDDTRALHHLVMEAYIDYIIDESPGH